VLYYKKVFLPSLSLSSVSSAFSSPIYSTSFQTILTLTNIGALHLRLLMCCSRSYRSNLNSSIYMHAQVQELKSSSLYLCCHDSQQSTHGVLGVVHHYRLLSPFSKWLPNNLLFLRANLINLFLEANCIELF